MISYFYNPNDKSSLAVDTLAHSMRADSGALVRTSPASSMDAPQTHERCSTTSLHRHTQVCVVSHKKADQQAVVVGGGGGDGDDKVWLGKGERPRHPGSRGMRDPKLSRCSFTCPSSDLGFLSLYLPESCVSLSVLSAQTVPFYAVSRWLLCTREACHAESFDE